MQPEIVTTAEAAKRLRVHPATVRRWIEKGDIPAIRFGRGRYRIRTADLDSVLAGKR